MNGRQVLAAALNRMGCEQGVEIAKSDEDPRTVIIEYAPQSLGGDVTMHLHSTYRDATNRCDRKHAGP